MVVSGTTCPEQAGVREVAEATIRCLRDNVPVAVPGIVFLSGGQSDELATAHLDAMNRLEPQPWQLSFSYGRALQAPALKAWKGETANVAAAKLALYHRAMLNGAARFGRYSEEMETAAAGGKRAEHDPHRGVDRWWRCPGIELVHQDAGLRRR